MKTARSLAGSIIAWAWILLLSACSVLPPPQPDRTKYFVLTSIAGAKDPVAPATTVVSGTSTLIVGLGPIKFPQYLRRPEVVTRTSPSQVSISDTDRWAEPLDSGFARVMSENLSQLLGTQQIVTFPWYNPNRLDYQVVVNVRRFETDAKGQPELDAQWDIRDGHGTKLLAARESDITAPADPGDPSPSAGLSQALGSLSREIASEITQLNQQSKLG
jgi:uncharacterized lipoprotein YmbA